MNKPLKWIISNSLFMLPLLLVLVVTNVLVSVCTVWFALLSKNVVDIAVSGGSHLLNEGLKIGVLIAAEIILRVINSRMQVSFGGKLEMHLREKVFSSILKKKWSDVSQFHSGEIVNRIKSDTSVITNGIMHLLPNGAMFITRIILALSVLFTIDKTFATIILIASPVLLIIGRIYSKKMKFFHKEVQKSEGASASYMLESIQNLTVVKAFSSEASSAKELHKIQEETLALRIRRNAWSILANVSMMLLFTGGYAFTVLWGAFRIASGALTFGSFTAMLQLVNQVQTPAKNMGSLLVSYQNTIASAERILEFELLANDIQSPSSHDVDFESIELNSVSFAYDGDLILNSASASIHKGEFVALCGISGAGKSTIIRLLLSLVEPQSGSIVIKGKNSLPISSDCRSLFGYVPQGNMLISGTIADNIAFYSNPGKKAIEQAAKTAQMDFVSMLPDKLDTMLGEKGSGLSEGQVQRIAIARALVRNTPILLLDEATSALDEDTEIKLLDALKEDKSKTVLIITHRKKVLDYCDKVITLTDGKLKTS